MTFSDLVSKEGRFKLDWFIGKKNTKIYKAEHIPTGKIYAIKEVEAKTLEKLNEYKVNITINIFLSL